MSDKSFEVAKDVQVHDDSGAKTIAAEAYAPKSGGPGESKSRHPEQGELKHFGPGPTFEMGKLEGGGKRLEEGGKRLEHGEPKDNCTGPKVMIEGAARK